MRCLKILKYVTLIRIEELFIINPRLIKLFVLFQTNPFAAFWLVVYQEGALLFFSLAWEIFSFMAFVTFVLSFSISGGFVSFYLWGKFGIPHYYSISGGFFCWSHLVSSDGV